MTASNLLLTGGHPGHAWSALGASVAATLADEDIATTIIDDPDELVGHLRGDHRPDLVTVAALRWTMGAERYAEHRARWAHSADGATRQALADHVGLGGGLLAVHTACICFDDWPGWGDLLGAAWSWDRSSHLPAAPVRIEPTGSTHPITAGVAPFTVTDEVYGGLDERPGLEALATSPQDGRDQPVLWARQHGRGRVVVDTLGHTTDSLEHPAHRVVLRRGALWALGRSGPEVAAAGCPVSRAADR